MRIIRIPRHANNSTSFAAFTIGYLCGRGRRVHGAPAFGRSGMILDDLGTVFYVVLGLQKSCITASCFSPGRIETVTPVFVLPKASIRNNSPPCVRQQAGRWGRVGLGWVGWWAGGGWWYGGMVHDGVMGKTFGFDYHCYYDYYFYYDYYYDYYYYNDFYNYYYYYYY